MLRRELPMYNGMFPFPSKRKTMVFATPLVTMEVKSIKMTQRCLQIEYICILNTHRIEYNR